MNLNANYKVWFSRKTRDGDRVDEKLTILANSEADARFLVDERYDDVIVYSITPSKGEENGKQPRTV